MSYSFDGSNDFLSGAFASTYGDPLTIACFIKVTSHPLANDAIVSLGASSSGTPNSYMLRTGSSDDSWEARSEDTAGSASIATLAGANIDGAWTGIVGVFAASDASRTIYVGSIANTATSSATRSVTAVQNIRLGENFAGSADFTGLMANVAVWNTALGADDITAFLAGSSPSDISAANLIGYWPLSASNATQSNEGVDAGGDLTVNGAAYSADHPSILTKMLKVLAHADFASQTGIEGVVLNAARDTVIGEFTGQASEASLEAGEAVLLVAVTDITPYGSTLTTSDTPIVFAYNATDSLVGPASATVIEV